MAYPKRMYREVWPETISDVENWLSNARLHLLNRDNDRTYETLDARVKLLDARLALNVTVDNYNQTIEDALLAVTK